MRERLEAVEMPLNRTNQSQNARQRDLGSVGIDFHPLHPIGFAEKGKDAWGSSHGRGLGCEFDGGFFELEMPKLMRKKRKPLRSESRRDMGGLIQR